MSESAIFASRRRNGRTSMRHFSPDESTRRRELKRRYCAERFDHTICDASKLTFICWFYISDDLTFESDKSRPPTPRHRDRSSSSSRNDSIVYITRVMNMKPPRFNGSNTAVETFVCKFENCAEFNDLSVVRRAESELSIQCWWTGVRRPVGIIRWRTHLRAKRRFTFRSPSSIEMQSLNCCRGRLPSPFEIGTSRGSQAARQALINYGW